MPRRALKVSECEIARAFKVVSHSGASSIEPIAFIAPRKADSFHADIYPLAPSDEPSLTAGEFFAGSGEIVKKLVDLGSGVITPSPYTPSPANFSVGLPSKTPDNSQFQKTLPPSVVPSNSTLSTSPTSSIAGPKAVAPLGAATLSTAFKSQVRAQEYTAQEVDARDEDEPAQVRSLFIPALP